MLEDRSKIISIKRYFLWRLSARLFYLADLFAFFFCPFPILLLLLGIHVVLYRQYCLAFVGYSLCFVYPKE